jgi:Protein of unknown function (DUF3581)
MQLEDYYDSHGNGIRFTRQQASDFAKGVAGDFNPIHNVDAKRFCVPGDLLFSVALQRYGLSQKMRVVFSGMVGDGVTLDFPETADSSVSVRDSHGKTCLNLQRSGPVSTDPGTVCGIIHCYVQFSGQAFPHILVPLMAEHGLMVNPERPLIIYESMAIELDSLSFDSPRLELTDARLDIQGKRGDAHLRFAVKSGEHTIGRGAKSMVLSGLRPFVSEEIDMLVNDYMTRKNNFGAGS